MAIVTPVPTGIVQSLLDKVKNDPVLNQKAQETFDDYLEHVNVYLSNKKGEKPLLNPDEGFMEQIEENVGMALAMESNEFRQRLMEIYPIMTVWHTSPVKVGIAFYVKAIWGDLFLDEEIKKKIRYRKLTDPWEPSW